MDKKAYHNTGHCPNTEKPVLRERGDFITDDKGNSRYIVESSWTEYIPCLETRYKEFDNYEVPLGIDPAAKRVQCVSCGLKYWLLPRITVKSETG